ncbi:type IV secretion system DNA-binding domain-containing protein (plasmid) [Halorussus limi]|uniref:Type IV secretion system DNA-binding domain-containing protein n=1 Tax=Halorussus limi TaxID=2938695 RepID=A0A8U0HZR3_9EURY|nr:type IV secretion system DNA-binding domain-containing protein [Halorussus limi]UPV76622.1 type IV secretion system DNA-binding domain-containing protein [Halorussus limi]
MTTRTGSRSGSSAGSGSSSGSSSGSGSGSEATYEHDEVEIFFIIALVSATALLIPWIYAILERANLSGLKFEGLHRSRALWVLPVFYGFGALGTVLLFPAHLQLFWAFHILLLAQLAELAIHATGNLVGMSLPLVEQFTLWRVGGFLLLFVGTVRAGLWFRTWDTARECRRHISDGKYVLPFRQPSDSSEHMSLKRFVPLEKDRSLLVLGETGAGKTETMKLFVHQMRAKLDEAFVVFDYKGEYRQIFTEAQGEENVICLSSRGETVSWNLFCEIKYERDIEEIGRALFPETDEGEFFENAARQLFVAVVTYLHREGLMSKTVPTNADLVAFVEQTDKQELYERLAEYPDLVAAASAIDPDADRQAAGVYANFQQVIADLFRGDLADDGEFSIREYMEDPQGRTLVLDFPITEGEAVQPAFRFFIDWAARFALSDDRNTYFVLDEFARLPKLRKIGDLINAGRSRNTQLLLGVQSVAQLNDTYGRDRASALLSGLVQSVVLRVGDKASVDYTRSQIGREHQHRSVPVRGRSGRSVGRQELTSETHPIAENSLQRLGDGEAIVITSKGWIRGQIARFQKVRSALDRAIDREPE